MLDLIQLAASPKVQKITRDVGEWYIREPSLGVIFEYSTMLGDKANYAKAQAFLISECVCDASGNRIYSGKVSELESLPRSITNAIIDSLGAITGLATQSVEDNSKN